MELEGIQQRLTNDIRGYKELLLEGIITEKEFSIRGNDRVTTVYCKVI